ncbi:MAG: hypothetical protein WA996_18820, partial [Candidatus Promineifilaceae bacterium]
MPPLTRSQKHRPGQVSDSPFFGRNRAHGRRLSFDPKSPKKGLLAAAKLELVVVEGGPEPGEP